MKYFEDNSGRSPLVDHSDSELGSSPTAAHFNGITAELCNLVKGVGLPLNPSSGNGTGSDGLSVFESSSNKQIFYAVDKLVQDYYLQSKEQLRQIISTRLSYAYNDTALIGAREEGYTIYFNSSLSKWMIKKGLGYTADGHIMILEQDEIIDIKSLCQHAPDHLLHFQISRKYILQEEDYHWDSPTPRYKKTERYEFIYTPIEHINISVTSSKLEPNHFVFAKISIRYHSDHTEEFIDHRILNNLAQYEYYRGFKRNHHIGFTYTQYATENTNHFDNSKSPASALGDFGTWVLRYQGKSLAFRTEGTEANLNRGNDGIQHSAIQHHQHDTHIGGHNHTTHIGKHGHNIPTNRGTASGSRIGILPPNPSNASGSFSVEETDLGTKTSNTVDLGTKRSGNQVTGNASSETRMKNALIRIYELVSYKDIMWFGVGRPPIEN
ncbi:MAG: hypothetical protein ACRC0X_02190 [Brevinema sp.]